MEIAVSSCVNPYVRVIHYFDVAEQPRGDARFPIPRNVVGGHAGEGVPEEKSAAEVRFLGKTEQHIQTQNNNQKHSLDHSAAKIQNNNAQFQQRGGLKKMYFCT